MEPDKSIGHIVISSAKQRAKNGRYWYIIELGSSPPRGSYDVVKSRELMFHDTRAFPLAATP